MAGIHLYNRTNEDHSNEPNNYPIYRPNILGNPYTHIKDKKTKALFIVNNRDEAIERYSHYFDLMYGSNIDFTKMIDEIYTKYKNGEDVWLECYCFPKPCHGDVIINKLRSRLIKEKMRSIK